MSFWACCREVSEGMSSRECSPSGDTGDSAPQPVNVWVKTAEHGFLPGTTDVESVEGEAKVSVTFLDQKLGAAEFKGNEVYRRYEEPIVPDNTQLVVLNPPAVVENTRQRYMEDKIYTYTGTVLTAVNPYQRLDMYDEKEMEKYRGKHVGHKNVAPHIFAVAERCYRRLSIDHKPQTILCSGESGAGKTETAKYAMRYLLSISGGSDCLGLLERQILAANIVFESLGNAKTLRNNNSSRFGKFTKILFDTMGKPAGSMIYTYLLEASRVPFQATGERNYHSFYQLCAGADEPMRKSLKLGENAKGFAYLTKGDCTEIDGVDDAAEYKRLVEAMNILGLSQDEIHGVLETLAAILHIGNAQFEPEDEDADSADRDAPAYMTNPDESISIAADLLKVDAEVLETRITIRAIHSGRGSVYNKHLSVHDCEYSRDGLSKALYGALFRWMVNRINKSLCPTNAEISMETSFVGILDIYGFEVFEKNSFEQLCINYANERLQHHFVNNLFVQELEAYRLEGISHVQVEYSNNYDCVQVIEQKGSGVFSVIDDVSRMPKATDEKIIDRLQELNPKNRALAQPRISRKQKFSPKEAFVLKHFAGDVTYCVEGMISKNNDSLHPDLVSIVESAGNDFVAGFKFIKAKSHTASTSVGSKFIAQLARLMDELNNTDPAYVRCIKPNDFQRARVFNGKKVWEQLQYGGMMECMAMMEAGYPSRCLYEDLVGRYAHLLPGCFSSLSARSICEGLMMVLNVPKDEYAMGLSRLFLKVGQMPLLDKLRAGGAEISEEVASSVRKWLALRRFRQVGTAIIAARRLETTLLRPVRAARRFRRAVRVMAIISKTFLRRARTIGARANAVRLIQKNARMFLARSQYRSILISISRCQMYARRWLLINEAKKTLETLRTERNVKEGAIKEAQLKKEEEERQKEEEERQKAEAEKRAAEERERLAEEARLAEIKREEEARIAEIKRQEEAAKLQAEHEAKVAAARAQEEEVRRRLEEQENALRQREEESARRLAQLEQLEKERLSEIEKLETERLRRLEEAEASAMDRIAREEEEQKRIMKEKMEAELKLKQEEEAEAQRLRDLAENEKNNSMAEIEQAKQAAEAEKARIQEEIESMRRSAADEAERVKKELMKKAREDCEHESIRLREGVYQEHEEERKRLHDEFSVMHEQERKTLKEEMRQNMAKEVEKQTLQLRQDIQKQLAMERLKRMEEARSNPSKIPVPRSTPILIRRPEFDVSMTFASAVAQDTSPASTSGASDKFGYSEEKRNRRRRLSGASTLSSRGRDSLSSVATSYFDDEDDETIDETAEYTEDCDTTENATVASDEESEESEEVDEPSTPLMDITSKAHRRMPSSARSTASNEPCDIENHNALNQRPATTPGKTPSKQMKVCSLNSAAPTTPAGTTGVSPNRRTPRAAGETPESMHRVLMPTRTRTGNRLFTATYGDESFTPKKTPKKTPAKGPKTPGRTPMKLQPLPVDAEGKPRPRLSMHVKLENGASGTVKYVGATKFSEGTWVGVVLDPGFVGKNDGRVDQYQYFKCDNKRGLFVKPSSVMGIIS